MWNTQYFLMYVLIEMVKKLWKLAQCGISVERMHKKTSRASISQVQHFIIYSYFNSFMDFDVWIWMITLIIF